MPVLVLPRPQVAWSELRAVAEQQTLELAAVRLQSNWRAKQQRKRFEKQLSASREKAREKELELKKSASASRIQSWIRKCQTRKRILEKEAAQRLRVVCGRVEQRANDQAVAPVCRLVQCRPTER